MRAARPVSLALAAASIAALVTCAIACAPEEPRDDDGAREAESAQTSQAIVNGTASPATEDAVVQISLDGVVGCTGTLLAPNLVLTARHCVSGKAQNADPDDLCALGPSVSPSTLGVSLGATIRNNGKAVVPDALGARILAPAEPTMCSHDVALILLDRVLPGVRVAGVRTTPVRRGESGLVAVGYGLDETGQLPGIRKRRGALVVLAVGPTSTKYVRANGKAVAFDLPQGDIATGESTCNGDSGGPLFDDQGKVVGVTSRGLPVQDDCSDNPALYASIAENTAVVQEALMAAQAAAEATARDAGAGDAGAAEEDDVTPADAGRARKVDRRATALQPSAGCAVAAGGVPSGPAPPAPARAALALVAILALGSTRRRPRRDILSNE